MADIVDSQTRSRMMSNIRNKNTKPEVRLRQALHREGFRFQTNVPSLPGTPDIVLPKWKTVIFVHGCFWHQHSGCRKATKPSTNPDFWQNKFDANKERDIKTLKQAHELGWRTAVVWECAIGRTVKMCLVNRIGEHIKSTDERHMEFGSS